MRAFSSVFAVMLGWAVHPTVAQHPAIHTFGTAMAHPYGLPMVHPYGHPLVHPYGHPLVHPMGHHAPLLAGSGGTDPKVAAKLRAAGDVLTCKLTGNDDKELDCFPMCVCHKFAWTIEYQPQLRQEVKTTKLCENWVEKGVMKEECMVTCASVAHAVYGAQGTDPQVCEHASNEIMQISGAMKFKELFSQKNKDRSNRLGAKSLKKNSEKWESLKEKASWIPSTPPPKSFLVDTV